MSLSSALRSSRNALPAARSYATQAALAVQQVSGINVASSDDGAPTAAITVVVKAGSRYEGAGPGLAHVLKNSVFKGTNKRSAIRLVRETEMFGGVLSASLTRENLILTAEFMRGDEGYFAEVLGDAITQAKFAPHEYNEEVLPKVASEYEQAIRDPTTYGLDLAHQLAFRNGLGNSLFASPHSAVNFNSATAYAASAFAPSNVAVLGSGVDAGLLASYVSEFFVSSSPAAAALSTPVASYFGGEVRVPSPGHGGSAVDHFIVAFKGNGSSASADFEVLRHLLGGESSVKWSSGSSPLSKLASGRSSAKAFNLAYSDAGLFGIYITAPTSGVAGIATAAVEQLKNVAKGASAEAVKQAIAKAKFAAATSMETRVNRLELVGGHIANSGSAPSLEEIFAKLDKVTPESVSQAAALALQSKPTTVAVGDTHHLPYADSIGL